jgi:hypothetical protein
VLLINECLLFISLWLSPETFGYNLVYWISWGVVSEIIFTSKISWSLSGSLPAIFRQDKLGINSKLSFSSATLGDSKYTWRSVNLGFGGGGGREDSDRSVLCVVTPCSDVVGYQRFGKPCASFFREKCWTQQVLPKRWCSTATLHWFPIQKTSTWVCAELRFERAGNKEEMVQKYY